MGVNTTALRTKPARRFGVLLSHAFARQVYGNFLTRRLAAAEGRRVVGPVHQRQRLPGQGVVAVLVAQNLRDVLVLGVDCPGQGGPGLVTSLPMRTEA